MTSLSDFRAISLRGNDEELSQYAGSVVLVVNTATNCGLAPQFAGLEELYRTYRDQGLVVLGFPSNQFAGQEPRTEEEIGEYCQANYGVTFPMFAKIDVNGRDTHPLFQWLKKESSGVLGSAIKWNFTKFLIGRDGTVIARYSPQTDPASIGPDIEKALATQR